MKEIILNQKCYFTKDEMNSYIKSFDKISLSKGYEFIIFPPILYLLNFENKDYKVGCQNFFSYNLGSFTGEIALEQLKKININYVMVSHPERRKLLSESYYLSKEKLYKSLRSNFNTILYIGEKKKIRNPFAYIKKELNYYLKDIESENLKYLSLCYEPNIVLGDIDVDIDKIEKIINKIKDYMINKYNINIKIYYGGSVDKYNIKSILGICDGVSLGKISTDIIALKDIVNALNDKK